MAYKVFGRVVVAETGQPIRDVLVAVQDVDMADVGLTSTASLITDASKARQLLRVEALGTAISGIDGGFKVKFDKDSFADGPEDDRPDLTVVAMAPAIASAGSTSATPAEARVLLAVRVPRVRAARSEGFVLRIGADQVAKHGLYVTSDSDGQDGSTGNQQDPIAQDVHKNLRDFNALASALHGAVRPSLSKRLALFDRAKTKAERFTSLDQTQRTSQFVVADDGERDRSERILRAQGAARTSGVNALARLDFGEVPLSVDPADFENLLPDGTSLDDDHWTLSLDRVCDLLHRTSGHHLVRLRSVLDALRTNHETAPDQEPAQEEDEEHEPTSAVDVESLTEDIQRRIEELIRDIGGVDPQGSLRPDSPLDLGRLYADLERVEIKPGPADTSAFHDFHALQVAMPDVWVEALNPDLRETIEWLYSEFVDLHEDFTGEPFPPDAVSLQEISDLDNFLRLLRREADAIERGVSHVVRPREEGSGEERHRVVVRPPGHERAPQSPAEEAEPRLTRLRRLLGELSTMLSEKWAFEYFSEDSSNLGILVTYRQTWKPGTYQAGDLMSAVTLAPGEERTVEVVETVQQTRGRKETDRTVRSRRGESTVTTRASDEIVRRAESATNFQLNAEGSISFGIGSIGSTSQFSQNQQLFSQETKSAFRESVVKASHEYSNDRTVEVAVSTDVTRKATSTARLTNPNDELSVTYLLYELQRQYTVSEAIQSVTPVILVAQPMPRPNEITEAWLLRHEWVIKQVLLDDDLRPALDYLTDTGVGDEVATEVRWANWQSQQALTERLEGELDRWTRRKRELQEVLIGTQHREALARAMEDNQGWLSDALENIVAYDFGDAAAETVAASVAAVEQRLTNVQTEIDSLSEQVGQAREAFQIATDELAEATALQTQRRVQIDQLRVHIKQNILHYMQPIWASEPRDQMFYRLAMKNVFVPNSGSATCPVRRARPDEDGQRIPGMPGDVRFVVESCSPPRFTELSGDQFQELYKVADLDRPLGFKGNYMIFPLKTCTLITDFMIRAYVDTTLGVRDPDEFADCTTDELIQASKELQLDAEDREALNDLIARRLTATRRETDTIVVPTGQMYMEALLGSQQLLEPFKLAHRGYDALRAREDLRRAALENLRYASRLASQDPLLGDPDADRHILVEGAGDALHLDVGGGG